MAPKKLSGLESDMRFYCRTGNLAEVVDCLARGASPNQEGVLYNASSGGHTEVVELLLSRGANPEGENQTDNAGGRPLQRAAHGGHLSIVEMLLAHGANPNAMTNNGWRPLHCAADGGHLEIVEKLLAHGADPNAKTSEHGTALGYAITGNHTGLIQLLRKVTDTRIAYKLDEALAMANPEEGYWKLFYEMAGEWHRGHTPAELRFLSLRHFFTHGLMNGAEEMLSWAGLWSIQSAIELFEAIDEPIYGQFLRDGLAIIRDECQAKGLEMTPDLGCELRFDEPAKLKLHALSSKLWSTPAPEIDDARVFRKTMEYVAKNRHLFENPTP